MPVTGARATVNRVRRNKQKSGDNGYRIISTNFASARSKLKLYCIEMFQRSMYASIVNLLSAELSQRANSANSAVFLATAGFTAEFGNVARSQAQRRNARRRAGDSRLSKW